MLPYRRLQNGGPASHDRRTLFTDPRFLLAAAACFLMVVVYAMSLRETPPVKLTATTWNVAAINQNPFEYWLTIPDDNAYAELMGKVEAMIKTPGAKNVLVNEVFTEDMARRLFKEMRALKWEGVDQVEELWKVDWAKRRIVSNFLRDADIGRKRLVSMPDRVTNTIGAPPEVLYRPTTINCYQDRIASLQDWFAKWLKFMFHTSTPSKGGKPPAELLQKIDRQKYPAVTVEEERISIALQTLVLAIFDAVQVRMLNMLAGVDPWQDMRKRICTALNLRKSQGVMDIVQRTYGGSDVVFLQEVGASLIQEATRMLSGTFHVVSSAQRSKSDQNSLVLLSKRFFLLDSIEEVTLQILEGLKDRSQAAAGDLLAITVTDLWGRQYLLASFHGDTNGLATIPVVTAVRQWAAQNPSYRLVFGLDANAHAQGEQGETLDVTEFANSFVGMGLNSCWGKSPDPKVHTTRNARTYMQPQLSKAASRAEVEAKGDCNPKDFVLFWDAQFIPVGVTRDNTGDRRYVEGTVFPTLTFPSDHAAVTADIVEV